jgi:glutaconate CoA-transferase, subunit B
MLNHSPRAFVERLDFKTSVGDRVRVVVTDLGVLEPDDDGELKLTHVHPDVEPERVQDATGWNLGIADELAVSEPPTDHELNALRSLRTKGTPT